MINLGDKVKYLGISYIVTDVNDLCVKLKREQQGTIELTILKGSSRFNAIFPGEVKTGKLNVELPEVQIREVPNRLYTDDGEYVFDEDGFIFKFVSKYCKENLEIETVTEIKSAILDELKKDNSGRVRFILTTWAHRNNSYKFDFYEIVDLIETNTIPRTQVYNRKLLEFYLLSLQDNAVPTAQEKENLVRLLPIDEQLSYLTCFCGFDWDDWGIATPPLKPKQILELLKEVKDDGTVDELVDDEADELE